MTIKDKLCVQLTYHIVWMETFYSFETVGFTNYWLMCLSRTHLPILIVFLKIEVECRLQA